MTNMLCDVIPVNVGGTSVVSFAFHSLYLVIASAFDCCSMWSILVQAELLGVPLQLALVVFLEC